STYEYDNYVSMGGMEDYGGTANPPGHLSWYNASVTARGNVTGTTQWTDVSGGTVIQHQAKYDIFGNVVKAQVSCCQEKDLTNNDGTDRWSDPIRKTLTTSQVYDGWGRVIQSVDRNNAQVNTSYDSMGRLASRTSPFTAGGTPGPATTIQYDIANKAVITTLP